MKPADWVGGFKTPTRYLSPRGIAHIPSCTMPGLIGLLSASKKRADFRWDSTIGDLAVILLCSGLTIGVVYFYATNDVCEVAFLTSPASNCEESTVEFSQTVEHPYDRGLGAPQVRVGLRGTNKPLLTDGFGGGCAAYIRNITDIAGEYRQYIGCVYNGASNGSRSASYIFSNKVGEASNLTLSGNGYEFKISFAGIVWYRDVSTTNEMTHAGMSLDTNSTILLGTRNPLCPRIHCNSTMRSGCGVDSRLFVCDSQPVIVEFETRLGPNDYSVPEFDPSDGPGCTRTNVGPEQTERIKNYMRGFLADAICTDNPVIYGVTRRHVNLMQEMRLGSPFKCESCRRRTTLEIISLTLPIVFGFYALLKVSLVRMHDAIYAIKRAVGSRKASCTPTRREHKDSDQGELGSQRATPLASTRDRRDAKGSLKLTQRKVEIDTDSKDARSNTQQQTRSHGG
ncbi:hypothetical protein AAMO2058_001379600 [Amorphochlora amoebiformis]